MKSKCVGSSKVKDHQVGLPQPIMCKLEALKSGLERECGPKTAREREEQKCAFLNWGPLLAS